jgi:hypothetical protein
MRAARYGDGIAVEELAELVEMITGTAVAPDSDTGVATPVGAAPVAVEIIVIVIGEV